MTQNNNDNTRDHLSGQFEIFNDGKECHQI